MEFPYHITLQEKRYDFYQKATQSDLTGMINAMANGDQRAADDRLP